MVGEEFPSAFSDFVEGSQVAGYRIVEPIGRGGMAVVYRARDTRLDRWVALKILAPDLALDEVFRQRFIRESRAAAAVDHPHIIPIFDAGEADGVLFIAMRYVVGHDVRSLLDRAGTLPAARAADIVAQVASALDAAHAYGLVHRDVKPANMLLSGPAESTAPDHVYLSDFGISKQSDAASNLTQTGQLLGTLDYLAPEQVEGRPVDGRADLYALACAAFEMLSGAPPFRRDQSLAVMWAQLSTPPPLLTSRRPDLPPAIDRVMAKALAKSPGDRYDSCLTFASSLHGACGLDTGPGPGSEPAPQTGDVYASAPRPRPTSLDLSGPPPAPPFDQRPFDQPAFDQPAFYRPPAGRPPPRRRSRSGLAIAAVCIAVLVLAAGAIALHSSSLLHRGPAGSPPVTSTSSSAVAVAAASPAAVVRMYISAINSRDYAEAWRLGGKNSGSTYPGFVRGFGTTRRDTVTIMSVSVNTVTARVSALQTDGTVQTYQGDYTVHHGVITKFNIRQLS